MKRKSRLEMKRKSWLELKISNILGEYLERNEGYDSAWICHSAILKQTTRRQVAQRLHQRSFSAKGWAATVRLPAAPKACADSTTTVQV